MEWAGMLHLDIDGHGRPLRMYNQRIHDYDVVQTQIQNHFFYLFQSIHPLYINKHNFFKLYAWNNKEIRNNKFTQDIINNN